MKTFLNILFFTLGISALAQTTAIPDPNFEQALIDLGIDSDGTINGQVLSADIANIHVLDVSNKAIQDLTGIEGFTALKSLNVSDTYLSTFDLSNNVLLEELYCNRAQDDVITLGLTHIDLSNNPNIHTIEAINMAGWVLVSINLKNGNNNNMTSFSLDISSGTGPRPYHEEKTNGLCIQVDDENAAIQNLFPYSTWTIVYSNTGYYFSADCSLGAESPLKENLRVFPNPVKDVLTIQSPGDHLEKVEVYGVQGKRLKSLSKNLERIDMQGFGPGVYFLKVYSDEGTSEEKIVKEQ